MHNVLSGNVLSVFVHYFQTDKLVRIFFSLTAFGTRFDVLKKTILSTITSENILKTFF